MNNIVSINTKKNNDRTGTGCGYSSTDIATLIFEVNESARKIHRTLKAGLPKCIYQLKLYNDLLKKGFQLQTEMSVLNLAIKHEAERELIIVNGSLVIECIVEESTDHQYRKKVMFDLENNGYDRGLLINFSDELQSQMIATAKHNPAIH